MDQMDQNVGRKMATVGNVLVEWLNKSRSHKRGEKGERGRKDRKATNSLRIAYTACWTRHLYLNCAIFAGPMNRQAQRRGEKGGSRERGASERER